jgi:amidase
MISGLVNEHALTRSVRDSAALLDATAGPDLGDPYQAPRKERPFLEEVGLSPGRLKIGFLTSVPEGWLEATELHPDCADAVKDAAQLCSDLGHVVEEIPRGELRQPGLAGVFNEMFSSFVGHTVAYWERELGRKIDQQALEPVTWSMYQAALKRTGADYLVAVEASQRFSRKIARWFHDGAYDVLLSPTMRIPPAKVGTLAWPPADLPTWRETVLSFGAFSYAFNLTGQPAASVPLFWNRDGIPIGTQFAGRFADEATLFRLAAQLERDRPWAYRRPRIHASALP